MNPEVPDNPTPEKGVEIDTGDKPDEINLDPDKKTEKNEENK